MAPVTFFDGSAALGTVNLVNGAALFAISTLTAGDHALTAAYSGNTNFAPSTSQAVTETIRRRAPLRLRDAESAAFGQQVTLRATVTPATATGTITFFDNSNSLGTVTLNNGIASLNVSNLSGGELFAGGVLQRGRRTNSSNSPIVVEVITQTSDNDFAGGHSAHGCAGPVGFLRGIGDACQRHRHGDLPGRQQHAWERHADRWHGDVQHFDSGVGDAFDHGGLWRRHQLCSEHIVRGSGDRGQPNYHHGPVGQPGGTEVGQSVTFTATVNPASATGTVAFRDGNTTLGSGTLNNGTATFSTSTLAGGSALDYGSL